MVVIVCMENEKKRRSKSCEWYVEIGHYPVVPRSIYVPLLREIIPLHYRTSAKSDPNAISALYIICKGHVNYFLCNTFAERTKLSPFLLEISGFKLFFFVGLFWLYNCVYVCSFFIFTFCRRFSYWCRPKMMDWDKMCHTINIIHMHTNRKRKLFLIKIQTHKLNTNSKVFQSKYFGQWMDLCWLLHMKYLSHWWWTVLLIFSIVRPFPLNLVEFNRRGGRMRLSVKGNLKHVRSHSGSNVLSHSHIKYLIAVILFDDMRYYRIFPSKFQFFFFGSILLVFFGFHSCLRDRDRRKARITFSTLSKQKERR